MESRVVPPAEASARQTEMGDTFDRVLFDALDAVQSRNIPYALIGGIAASGLGRPRSTHDIDIFVRPEDAEAALQALGQAGFEIERPDPRWLFKGWKDNMMVDIIFKSQGDIYFDDEMHRRAMPIHYHGRDIAAVSPEDLVIIKCAVHSEVGPHHWHDALAILSHANLDWEYLLKRARRAPRRLLALLVYAQSNDIWIPNDIVVNLFKTVFGDGTRTSAPKGASHKVSPATPSPANAPALDESEEKPNSNVYLKAHIQDALATDTRTAALDARVSIGEKSVLVKGQARTEEQRDAIEKVIRDIAKGYDVENQVRITRVSAPEQVEEVV